MSCTLVWGFGVCPPPSPVLRTACGVSATAAPCGDRQHQLRHRSTFFDADELFVSAEQKRPRPRAHQPDSLPAPRAELRWSFEQLDTAWCLGPQLDTAWCLGPQLDTAWCLGPQL
eukprot:gene15356-biopygen20175